MARPRPLSGVTVLAIEQLMALPFGTQILADLGAEVIGVSAIAAEGPEIVPWRERTGRHKRQLSVKLNDPAGQALLREIASQVDVVAENFRPGVMDRYGLGWQAMKAVNPRVIYASVSGYGHTDFLPSPQAELAAYGPIGEAMSGVMDAYRQAGAASLPMALGDIFSSVFATIGILAALRHRDLTGEGQYVDVAMADALFTLAELPFTRYALGLETGVTPTLPAYPWGTFSARDGDFFMIVLSDRHWQALCQAIGHEEWRAGRYQEAANRRADMAGVIIPGVNAWAGALPRAEAVERLRAAGLAAAPVNRPEDIAEDPHFAARRMIQTISRPGGGELRVVGSPIKLSGDLQPEAVAPVHGPGADNRKLLVERFGLSPERFDQLVADGIVGPEGG